MRKIIALALLTATWCPGVGAPSDVPQRKGPDGGPLIQPNASTVIQAGTAREALAAGNQRYLRGGVYTHSWLQERIEQTGFFGQTPSVGVLSCADSRVPVELIFDQGVGDLFVVRIAGNYESSGAAGTFEYGVAHLGVHTILVLGHSRCGAVEAALSGAALPGNMSAFTAAIRPALDAANKSGSTEPKGKTALDAAVELNVRWQLQQLMERSPILKKAKAEGRLDLLGGIYDVTTGVVRFLD